MSSPRVSIVIPTFNRVGFVEAAIMSVLDQDYENLELLVLDDGSTDETPQLLERIAARSDPARFSWDRHDNIGQSATLNKGFARVDGDYLGYLSSDDLLVPGAITKLVAAAEEHPTADVIYPWYRVDGLGSRPKDTVKTLKHDFVDALRWSICVPGVGAIVSRSFYERAGGWNEEYRHSPDVDWWFRLPDAEFVQVKEVLGLFTQHPGGISSAMDKIDYLNERLRIFDDVFSRRDLPPEALAVRDEAYGALMIEVGSTLYGAEPLDDPRWQLDDRLGPRLSVNAARQSEENHFSSRWALESAERQIESAQTSIDHLSHTVGVLEDAAQWREKRILELEAEIRRLREVASAAPPATPDRPRWKRTVRAIVPPPLRPRALAAYRRIKGTS